MDGRELQEQLFEAIRHRVKDQQDWVGEIAQVLSLSKPAVYKRVSGATSLSMDDLIKLSRRYKIEVDHFLHPDKNNIGFYFTAPENKITSLLQFIEPLKKDMASVGMFPDVHIQYAHSELPFFLYYMSRDLTYFKFYIYANTIWELPMYMDRKFDLEDFPGETPIMAMIDEFLDSYYAIPHKEFCDLTFLDNTLNQIKYFLSSGLFVNPEQALTILSALKALIDHMQQMAETGKKFQLGKVPAEKSPSFDLYHNEIAHVNNTLLITSKNANAVFSSYGNPNIIKSSKQSIVEYTSTWFERVQKNATPLTRDSKKNRLHFFSQLERKLEHTEKEIQMIVQSMI